MIRTLYSILFTFILLYNTQGLLFAQRERTERVKATGTYVANENETPAEAKAKALYKAKEEALRKAGVYEEISSTSSISMSSEGVNLQEYNSLEMGRLKLEGRVCVNEKLNESMQPKNGHIEYSVTILADVKVEETAEDLMFDFTTDGIRNTYIDGQMMTFTVTPTKDCYLRIFYMAANPNNNSTLVFPDNKNYKDVKFKANTSYSFPPPNEPEYLKDFRSKAQDYPMIVGNISNNSEQGWVIIVALKERIPFNYEEVTYTNLNNWLFRIKRNEKQVKEYGVNIVRQ